MKLVVFGSTGTGGSAVVTKVLERGHDVTVLARSQASADKAPHGVRVVRGDAVDPAAIERTLDGADAVIQYLGVGGLGDGKPNTLVPDATRVIIEEMRAQGIERLVCASNMGSPAPVHSSFAASWCRCSRADCRRSSTPKSRWKPCSKPAGWTGQPFASRR
ncbi:NAD(P)-dependent oxidoreductase [Nocardia sp. NPDC058518]|uniref:NAD(P)-dependent oxidoreductase n=1 Tax=Nocardia sp. NPDC058518 TaxID=3346534 RepID=UPI0036464604